MFKRFNKNGEAVLIVVDLTFLKFGFVILSERNVLKKLSESNM